MRLITSVSRWSKSGCSVLRRDLLRLSCFLGLDRESSVKLSMSESSSSVKSCGMYFCRLLELIIERLERTLKAGEAALE
jgi:hypothetical protein